MKYLKMLLTTIQTLWQFISTLTLGLTTFFLIGYVQIWFDERVAMFEKWLGITPLRSQGGIFELLDFTGYTPSMPNFWELLSQSIWIGIGCTLVLLPVIYFIHQKQLKTCR